MRAPGAADPGGGPEVLHAIALRGVALVAERLNVGDPVRPAGVERLHVVHSERLCFSAAEAQATGTEAEAAPLAGGKPALGAQAAGAAVLAIDLAAKAP